MTDHTAATPVTTLEFTEEMKGYLTLGETDPDAGFRAGKRAKTFAMFHLTIEVDDVERFVADPRHEASARGWVECDALGGRLPVEKGVFNLFVDTDDPSTRNMLYRLPFADGAGNPLTLTGFKDVRDDRGLDLWRDTTTLFVKVLQGHVDADGDGAAETVAAGVLVIHLLDFMEQLTTFRVQGPDAGARARALGDFGRLFMGALWELYRGRAEAGAGER